MPTKAPQAYIGCGEGLFTLRNKMATWNIIKVSTEGDVNVQPLAFPLYGMEPTDYHLSRSKSVWSKCLRGLQWHINMCSQSTKTKHDARRGYFGVREWLDMKPYKLGPRRCPKPTLDSGRVCSHSGTKWRHEVSFRFQPMVISMCIIRTRTIIGGIISDIVFNPWPFHYMGPDRCTTTYGGGNRFEVSA